MAISVDLGSLTITLGSDVTPFTKGVKQVQVDLKETGEKIREGVNEWGKWALAGATAAAGVAAALIKHNLTGIRELKNLAQAANVTVKEFQQGAFAAQQFGIEQEKYGDILKDVNDRIGDFLTTGGGPMLDFFEQVAPKIGVTADQFKGLGGQQALGLYIQSLQKANLSQEEMTFYMEALASDSTRLLPLFQNNGKAMAEMAAKAESLGIGLDAVDVAKAVEAQQKLDQIAFILDNELKKAVAELAPFISAIADELVGAAEEAGGFAQYAIGAFEAVGKAVAVLGDGIRGIHVIIKGIEVIARGVTSAVAFGFEKLSEIVVGIGNTILEGWRLVFKELGELAGTFSDDAKAVFDGLADAVNNMKAEVPAFVKDFTNAQIDGLRQAKDELHELAMEKLPSQRFEQFIEEVKSKAEEAAPAIAEALSGGAVTQGSSPGAGTGMNRGEKSEADRIREENKGILEALLEQSAIREETLIGRLEREKEIIDAARENEQISEAEHLRLMNDLRRREEETKLGIITSTLDAAIEALSLGGKKASKLQQNLAIVNAVIKGKEAAVAAWNAGMSTGGPWAPVVAAAYTAASISRTASMIRSIKSGGKSMSGMGGGVAPTPGSSSEGGGSGTGESPSPQMTRNFFVHMPEEGMMSTSQVRQLMRQMDEQAGQGFNLRTVTIGG